MSGFGIKGCVKELILTSDKTILQYI